MARSVHGLVARERRLGLALVGPTLLILGLVLAAPTVFAAVYSLMDIRLAQVQGFAGAFNWEQAVFTQEFIALLGRTAVFVIGSLLLTLVVSFPIALGLHRLTQRRALWFQLVVILPWVLSTIVAALLFRWTFLESLGLGAWLTDVLFDHRWEPLLTPAGAMTSMIVVATWRTTGFAVLLLLAGLKAVDADVYEAARVDGASWFQTFVHITIPMIRTPLSIVTVVLVMSNLNSVEVPLVITGGGPGESTMTLALEIYHTAFTGLDFGGAAALATAAAVINVALVYAYVRLTRLNT